MSKYFSLQSLVAILVASMSVLWMEAATFDVGQLKYNTLSGNNVEVAGPADGATVTDIVVPETVTNAGTTYNVTAIGARAFMQKTSLKSVKMHNNIASIGVYAFAWTSITEVVVPNKVTDLPRGVFYNSKLQKVTIPNSVVSLGLGAVGGNPYLEEVVMSNNIRSIGGECFISDSKLTSLILPATLVTLDYDVFSGCTGMTTLTCLAPTPPTSGGNPFGQNANHAPLNQQTCKLIVPAGSVDLYKAAEYWKEFATIEAQIFDGCAVMVSERIGTEMVQTGEAFSLPFKINNAGRETAQSIECSYSIAGLTGTTSYILPTPLATGEEGTAILNFPAISQPGSYELTLAVTRVNGKVNATPEPKVFKVKVGDVLQMPEDAVAFTYCKEYTGNYFGLFATYPWKVAMQLKDPSLVGMKVVGMKVEHLFPDASKTAGWLANTLNGTSFMQKIEADPYAGTMTVVFPEPYVLTESGIYVGYDMTAEKVPLGSPKDVRGSCYLTYESGSLGDFSSYGAATITVYLTGDLSADCVSVQPYTGNTLVISKEPFPMTFTVANQGSNEVKEVEYSVTAGGQTKDGKADVTIGKTLGGTGNIAVQVPALPTTGSQKVDLTITKVNGNLNTCPNNKLSVDVNAMSFRALNHPVMEEATGTWCGWCTRGWLALELMNDSVPDFIGLAWHNKDPMTVSNNFPFSFGGGFPGAALNRTINELDPFFGKQDSGFGIMSLYKQTANELAPAAMSIATEWNSDKSALDVTTNVKFAGDFSGYKLGYVLAANGYNHSDDPNWAQANYYSGGSYTGVLAQLTQLPDPIKDFTFNFVAIGVGDATGVAGSLPASVKQDQSYTHNHQIATESIRGILEFDQEVNGEEVKASYELIENKDNLYVVALLLAPDGHIMNACQAKAGGESVGVDQVVIAPSHTPAGYYDLMGRRVQNPQHGIYIRVQDGKASKVAL